MTRLLLSLSLLLAACGDDDGEAVDSGADSAADSDRPDGDDDAAVEDDAAVDSAEDTAVEEDAASDASEDAGEECVLPPLDEITGTEGLAFAPDGTLYYSQNGGVGRWIPGGDPEDNWVEIDGASTVWGLALRGPSLFVAVPSAAAGSIWRIDVGAEDPEAVEIRNEAGSPNGIIIGPDDAVYYSDFDEGRVYRIDADDTCSSGGTPCDRHEVTEGTISGANGLLFLDDDTLLVASYGTGTVFELTIDELHDEVDRSTYFEDGDFAIDGLAMDDDGLLYLGENGGGALLRFDPDAAKASTEVLLEDVPAAANIVWGRGPICPNSVFVASSGDLALYEAGVDGRP